jgi:lipopolysaccharide export system permease protein
MTLSLYIARRFLWMVLRVLLIFFGILVLIDMIEQLRRFGDADLGLWDALYLSMLNVPESLYNILPLIMIIASITLFLNLARSSELVVVRASGRSGLRFLATPVAAALVIGCLTVGVFNPIVAGTTKAYADARTRLSQGAAGSVLSVSDSGLWLRQGAAGGQTVVRAARANSDGSELQEVTFLIFDRAGQPIRRIDSERAILEPGAWVITKSKVWDLTKPNPESSVEPQLSDIRLGSELTVEYIRDSFGAPASIPFWQLPDYINGLERAGFSARAHQVWLQMELAQPMLLAAMVLVAAGFTMRHVRFGSTGVMVLMALLCGFAIFFLRNFAQVLGVNGQIPVLLAAWTPPVAAVFMALGLLLHLEDG